MLPLVVPSLESRSKSKKTPSVFVIWLVSQTSWLELLSEPSRADLLARLYNEPSRAEPAH